MKVTYQSRNYSPKQVKKRYVRRSVSGAYEFCEIGQEAKFDVRQGTVEPHEIPDAVRAAADNSSGQYFGYVDWPFSQST